MTRRSARCRILTNDPFLTLPLGMLLVVLAFAPASSYAQKPVEQRISRAEYLLAYDSRRDSLIDYYANNVNESDLARGGYIEIAAKLRRGMDMEWVLARLDTLMRDPRGDMFWMYPITELMFEGKGRLPESYRKRLRDLWRTYMPYRGDTENHWVLYYSTLYLMSEEYPNEPGDTWFTGKSSEENLIEAREWLLHWMELTTTIGQGEYDSPHYIKVFTAPMLLLYAHARDRAMKQRAAMMLDALIADFASESLEGIYTGAHSRIYEAEALEPFRTAAARFSWLLWGNVPFAPSGETYLLATSGYVPPSILYHIATDRSTSYVHRELKRTRHRIRNSEVKNAPVYKYTFMHQDFALGSSQGGLLQPIQQQTWTLTWTTDHQRTAHNRFFTVQPYSSPLEGTMYFAEPVEMVTELIVRSKTEYDSPDKWTGGSPYEQVFQWEDALIALYDIPEGTRFPHISTFFSRDLQNVDEDPSGWIFARGGKALIAYYPLAPYQWRDEEGGDRRLHSSHLKNGAVVQVGSLSEYESMEAFREAVLALELDVSVDPAVHVRYETLRGAEVEVVYGGVPRVDGEEVDYGRWPLYGGPFMEAERGVGRLELRYGPQRRVLDFNTLTVTDTVDQSPEKFEIDSGEVVIANRSQDLEKLHG